MNKLIIVLILFGTLLSSCNRKIGAVFTGNDKLEIIDPDFEFFTSKAKFKFDDKGKKTTATANFRISKDSIIWISISVAGFEGARVLIDSENVRLLDRLKKRYYEYTFDEISEEYGFDVSFKMVQSVLLGNLIKPYENQKFRKYDQHFIYEDLQDGYNFENFIGSNSMKLEKVNVLDKTTNNTISVNYSDFILVEKEVFPNVISAVIDYASADKPSTKINISYSKMEIETSPLKFPFSVSSKYERK